MSEDEYNLYPDTYAAENTDQLERQQHELSAAFSTLQELEEEIELVENSYTDSDDSDDSLLLA